ncbi:hypothetical protein CGB81_00530 [Klebsiella pneumoniae]|nr:hypothetical protein [Klebsiella pneumoniae]
MGELTSERDELRKKINFLNKEIQNLKSNIEDANSIITEKNERISQLENSRESLLAQFNLDIASQSKLQQSSPLASASEVEMLKTKIDNSLLKYNEKNKEYIIKDSKNIKN